MKPLLRAIAMVAVVSISACGSDKASHDGGPRGGAGGQAGASAGRGGTGGGAAGTTGAAGSAGGSGTTGSAGTGGGAGTASGGTGGAVGGSGGAAAGTGGAAAGTGGATGGRGGTSGSAGATGGTTGAAGRGGTGGGGGATAGTTGAAGRGGTGGTAGTTGTAGAAAGTTGAAGRGGTGGTAGGGGGGGTRIACQSDNDCQLFKCCDGFCVNTRNDIANCGACNRVCAGPNPYCGNGTCGMPQCALDGPCPDGRTCCLGTCCTTGQLCCTVDIGPGVTSCFDPVNGTCPQGCIGGCPCTAATTPIATPSGARPIAELRIGDLVYSVHRGALAVVPIKLVHRTPVAPTHQVVELRLAHSVVLHVTPNHPTADGRTFGDLVAGDRLDGVSVTAAHTVAYGQSFTYDILPDSDSGTYVAGGVLIGSALAAPVTGHQTVVDPSRPGRRASLAR